jgi:hypothetical protein
LRESWAAAALVLQLVPLLQLPQRLRRGRSLAPRRLLSLLLLLCQKVSLLLRQFAHTRQLYL